MTWRDPGGRPAGPSARTWRERFGALPEVWAVLVLFVLVMGGIYGGLFTATEGAAVGAAGAFVFALARGGSRWRTLYEALLESARTTGMMFLVLIGALMFADFVNIAGVPGELRRLWRA